MIEADEGLLVAGDDSLQQLGIRPLHFPHTPKVAPHRGFTRIAAAGRGSSKKPPTGVLEIFTGL